MILTLIFPLASLVATYTLFYGNSTEVGNSTKIRVSLLMALLIFGTYLVCVTEILSLYHLIKFEWILLAWIVPAVFATLYAIKKGAYVVGLRELIYNVRSLASDTISKLILFIICTSLLIALFYPPNNYDSLTYHMARVAHWIQNQSVENYSTHILRQLIYQPLAEWFILHLQILSGTDLLANSVQLFFFVGSINVVTLLAKELGGSTKQQMFSALIAALIPMAIIQSNTTQNDIVVAFFVLSFIYFTLIQIRSFSIKLLVFAGIALGLAWLTKGTAYLFTLPFCIWYIFLVFKKGKKSFKQLLMVGLQMSIVPIIAIIINSGFYYRNYQLTGAILGHANKGLANESHEIPQLIFVGIKNTLNHMPMMGRIKILVTNIAGYLGVDIDDPRYNTNTFYWMKVGFSFHEDYAQNFIHVLFILSLIAAWLYRRKPFHQSGRTYNYYLITILASAILFTIILKWQPWSNRLETVLFMSLSVILGLEIACISNKLRAFTLIPMVGFGLAALLWSSNHKVLPITRSIVMKSYDSFIYNDGELASAKYVDSVGYKSIGLYIGPDSKDYIFYKLLSNKKIKNRRLEHVLVENESSIYRTGFTPDVILSLYATQQLLNVNNRNYSRKKIFSGVAVYARD